MRARAAFLLMVVPLALLAACKRSPPLQPEEVAEAKLLRELPRAKGHLSELSVVDRRLLVISGSPDLVRVMVATACTQTPKEALVTAKLLAVNFEEKRGVPAAVMCTGDVTASPDVDWKGLDRTKTCGDTLMSCPTAMSLAKSAAWLELNQSLAAHTQTVVAFIRAHSRNAPASP